MTFTGLSFTGARGLGVGPMKGRGAGGSSGMTSSGFMIGSEVRSTTSATSVCRGGGTSSARGWWAR